MEIKIKSELKNEYDNDSSEVMSFTAKDNYTTML